MISSIPRWICLLGLGLMGFSEPRSLVAHGGHIHVLQPAGVQLIEATYDSGQPIVGARVSLFAPGSQEPFLHAQTDRRGRFAFATEEPGKWKISVDDGQGHRFSKIIDVAISEVGGGMASSINAENAERAGGSRRPVAKLIERIFMGLCLIFGFMGLAIWWNLRKINKAPGP